MTWGNRITNVELNPGAWNWKKFLEPLNINISGLASTGMKPDVCHTWRFVRRQDMHQHVPREVADMLVVPHDFASEQAHPNDCVLLLKQWMCSHELSQPPVLLLPHSRLANLTPDTLVPLERNALASNQPQVPECPVSSRSELKT